ncbi:MAG: type I 3-dehydroquinate dehydratase [Syntrophobacter sp.]
MIERATGSRRVGRGICGCLLNCELDEFSGYLNHPNIDMVEWRIDEFLLRHPRERMPLFNGKISASPRHALMATNRPVRELGSFEGPEDLRLKTIEEAAVAGAEWVDIEHDVALQFVPRFHEAGARVLVSWHSPAETPSGRDLRARLEKMCKTGADAIKIATLARTDEDNLRVLELIPLARKEFNIDLIAFCMGSAGKWSRIAALFLGSPWTYARMPGQPPAAPGQLSAEEIGTVVDLMERA